MNAPLCSWELAVELACQHANYVGTADPKDALDAAQDTLDRLGWGNATFGIEYSSIPDQCNAPEADYELAYLNVGETYSLTVGFADGKCFPTSWGDWYEHAEQEYCTDNDVIRCSYCGHYTPLDDPDNWSDTVCESCNHLVGG